VADDLHPQEARRYRQVTRQMRVVAEEVDVPHPQEARRYRQVTRQMRVVAEEVDVLRRQ
jgi:hypothetical protein